MGDGLLSNCVRSISQDKQGFLWFATDNGLCRYDGIAIKQYRNADLGGDQYTSVVLASHDSVFVGTNKGVFTLDTSTERFLRLSASIKTGVSSMALDADGGLWISTVSQGVFCKVKATEKLKNIVFQGLGKNVSISQVYVDNDNQIWALSKTIAPYIWRLNKSTGQFVPIKINTRVSEYGSLCMIQTKDGTRWLGTWNHGLMRLSDNGSLEQTDAKYPHIHCLYETSPNHIAIGCDEGLMDFCTPPNSSLIPHPSSLIPHPSKFIYSIIKDAEGGIWYSTFYGGVNYISPVGNFFQTYCPDNTPNLRGQVISRFCEDNLGHIWIASDDGGICCYDIKSKTVEKITLSTEKTENVHALCLDGEDLWIGTYSNGIYIKNVRTGRVTHCSQPSAPHSCYAIFKDSRGRMWVSSMSGILLYDQKTKSFRNIKELNSMIVDIDEDRYGRLWFSTQSNGLWTLDKQSHWKHYSISNNQVNSVDITDDGTVYAATGNGLFFYRSKKDDFEQIDLVIPIKNVSSIVDVQGELWLSTDRGIIKYTDSEGILIYNKYDGLLSEMFLPNAAILASDGRVYFGSSNGFCAFYPYQIKINKVEPNVFITSLEIFNKQVEVGSDALPLSLSTIEQLDIYSDDEMFSICFAALSYCSPMKNQYAYMLEGFDKEWIYCGSEHKATYTNLPAGTYTFHVKGTNNDGVWSSHEATLKIVVHPPFWWSWQAKLLYLILMVLGVYVYIQLRLRKEKLLHQQELEQLKEKQEHDAQKARLAFFTTIAHEIRTPVSLIMAPLEQLMKNNNSLSLNVINRNAHRLLDLVNQLLDFNKMQHRGLEPHFRQTNIRQLMESVAERFAPTFEQKGYKFEVEYPPADFSANIDPEGITKVISNFLTNANKYTKDTVKLSCTVNHVEGVPDTFVLVVEDNGIGISKTEQNRIFDAFYQASDNKPGTGIGLNIVKRIVELHNGEVYVDSEVGNGSKFVVKLTSQPLTALQIEDEDAAAKEHAEIIDKDVSELETSKPSLTNQKSSEIHEPSTLLLVEDNPDMLEFLSANLASNYTVLTAENGRQALDVLSHNSISLIVSDWMMPVMDGATFCSRVRNNLNTSHIPFIMLTAKTDDDSKAESMICGADAFIEKPFSMKYLEACITNLITMRRQLFQSFSGNPDTSISEISNNTVDDVFLKKMNSLIEENINNSDLNVNFLAESLAISRSGLFAKIKAISGTTPNEMIQVVRLKRAAQLLSTKKYRVNEVCYMVGFSNPSYFTKCFYKQFGKKPAEFLADK